MRNGQRTPFQFSLFTAFSLLTAANVVAALLANGPPRPATPGALAPMLFSVTTLTLLVTAAALAIPLGAIVYLVLDRELEPGARQTQR